jgi:hypothetical protein
MVFKPISNRRRVAKRKGFSDNLVHIAQGVAFAKEGLN